MYKGTDDVQYQLLSSSIMNAPAGLRNNVGMNGLPPLLLLTNSLYTHHTHSANTRRKLPLSLPIYYMLPNTYTEKVGY